MSDRTNHRRVLHFAVTGVLLGGTVGCASNEPAKADTKTDPKESKGRVIVNQDPVDPPEPEPKPEVREFAPNPGPNELEGVVPPVVAPTTAAPPVDPPAEPIQDEYVNERPVADPTPVEPLPDRALPEKRVNTQRVPDPAPAPIKVNPGPEG